ncbi:MAG: MNIO family bufferin maturase [Alphaproteobacteria bacterium]
MEPVNTAITSQVSSPDLPDLIPHNPVGIGLRSNHYEEIIEDKPRDIGWLEIHPENYFGGGLNRYFLDKIRTHYALSLHGVGLSLGADQPVSSPHLKAFKELIDRYEPFNISDHIAWSASGNAHLNDLLPLPYTQETLKRLCENIDQTQSYFKRNILVENPSTYIAFKGNEMDEHDFMNEVCKASECGILLDVNNIYVQSHNHGLDPYTYIDAINPDFVGEIHLAGHIEKAIGSESLLIDTHNQLVCDGVWELYHYTIEKMGQKPTLIEWDQDVPALQVLLDEANQAQSIINDIRNKTGRTHVTG